MTSDLFVQIVVVLIMFLGMVISSYLIPFMSSKTDSSEYAKLVDFAKKCVEWANQTIPVEEWQRKKTEVMALVIDFMKENLKITLSEEQISVIVEALVNEAKKIIKGDN